MKCPRCTTDSKKPERPDGKCPRCQYRFVFDPPAPLSDYQVWTAIQRVNSNGTYRYTHEQLVAEVERALLKKSREGTRGGYIALGAVGAILGLVFSIIMLSNGIFLALLVTVPFGGASLLFAVFSGRFVKLQDRAIDALQIVKTYASGAAVPGLLPKPETKPLPASQAAAREFDLESYGFDRIVAVQSAAIVDMLVANQFHVQHNAAVVSFDGYPHHVAQLVGRQISSGQVRAPVYLLHDCSAQGIKAAQTWMGSGWLGNTPIFRPGLFPNMVTRVHPRDTVTPAQTITLPVGASVTIDAEVPLHALRPVEIMTLLVNAFRQPEPETGLVVLSYTEASDGSYDFG